MKTRGKMKTSRGRGRNSSFVSIRKAHGRKYATDTNKDEKAQKPVLDNETLKTISRIVRAIKRRLEPDSGNTK